VETNKMRVILINRQNKIDLDLNLFKKLAGYISDKFEKNKNTELNIVFIQKDEIKQLNKKFRKIDKPTDVLSFSYHDDCTGFNVQKGFKTVGEILISPEVAIDNIQTGKIIPKQDWNFNKEIVLLIIHGLLHIFDYDHESKEDGIKMENIQKSLFNDASTNFGL
jgi:probable rRNA maturation factor